MEWAAPSSDGGTPVTKFILYVRPEHDPTYLQVYAGISRSFRLSAEQFPAILRPGF